MRLRRNANVATSSAVNLRIPVSTSSLEDLAISIMDVPYSFRG